MERPIWCIIFYSFGVANVTFGMSAFVGLQYAFALSVGLASFATLIVAGLRGN